MIMQCGPSEMEDDKANLEYAVNVHLLLMINFSSLFTIDNLSTENRYLTFSQVFFLT